MEVQFFYGKVKKIFSFFALYDSVSGKCTAGKSRDGDNRTLAILLEASTGQVIYEKNATERRSPASITKIMTLLLIFEALWRERFPCRMRW